MARHLRNGLPRKLSDSLPVDRAVWWLLRVRSQ